MKIVIPLDGSESALRAVRHVVADMAALKEPPQLSLLNVQWKLATGNVKLFISQDTINDYYREQGMAALAGGRAILDAAGMPYQYHISIGSPAEAIAQYVREQAADQVVMCQQGQGGVQQWLLGSVVGKLLHLVDCPVLLVK